MLTEDKNTNLPVERGEDMIVSLNFFIRVGIDDIKHFFEIKEPLYKLWRIIYSNRTVN